MYSVTYALYGTPYARLSEGKLKFMDSAAIQGTAVLTMLLVFISVMSLLPKPAPVEGSTCECPADVKGHLRVEIGGNAPVKVRRISIHPDGRVGPNSVHLKFPLFAPSSAPGTSWCLPEPLAAGNGLERHLVEVFQKNSWLQRAKPSSTWVAATNAAKPC